MNELYGEQDHLPIDVMTYASQIFPDLFIEALEYEKKHSGHICFIPFNKKGHEKMLSPHFPEDQMTPEDIYHPEFDDELFIFVYSIYGSKRAITKTLIEKTVQSCRQIIDKPMIKSSYIFAETVSKQGVLLAKRMGLKHHLSYQYQNETLLIYQTTLDNYINSFKFKLVTHI